MPQNTDADFDRFVRFTAALYISSSIPVQVEFVMTLEPLETQTV